MLIIAGLGNPGKEYENTRHNAGFMVMDALAEKIGADISEKKHKALCGKGVIGGEKVILMKPQTYMNSSGESIRAAADYYKVDPEDILIVYDDISLAPGQLRIRAKGSAGGHNGIKSIIAHLGTQEFPRVKVGVGEKPSRMDLADYVLGHFSKEEQATMDDAVKEAAEAVCEIVNVGIAQAMNDHNRKKEEKIKELQEFIQRFSANASKSKQATSRKRALEKIELDDIRPSSRKYPYIDFRPFREIGNEVLTVEHLSKTIDGEKILDDISFILGREDKVALVGPNERAKTVLFKILSGEMEPDEGSYKWGLTTSQAYFPKDNSAEFDNDDTIVEWLTQYSPEKDVTYVRGFLGRMLFAGEDGVKKVKVLSGGEKVRCMLSKMMISGANVLMLDEPTDHLDMESIDALNRGMIKFPGVMIFSSRDHQIVQTTANRIMEIINGKLVDKITTYDEYLESDEMARKRFTFTLTESEEADD